MKETQESITQWANDTFGIPVTNLSVAVRAQQEMTECARKPESGGL